VTDVAEADELILATAVEQVIEVTGEDRLSHLDATTTQALKDARPGTATAALALDANGNPLAVFDVLVLPDRLWLITPTPEVTAVVLQVIAGRTFLADARFTVLEHTVARVSVRPALAGRAFSGAAVVPDAGTVRSTPSGDTAIARGPGSRGGEVSDREAALDAGPELFTIVGPTAEVERLLARLRTSGAVDADARRTEAWRIAVGRPQWGRELAPPHLPEELGLLPSHVHLAKGCYPGQEAVARMWMLGRPRRRLAQVRINGDAEVEPGWTHGSGRSAVEVTSVLGGGSDGEATVALAFVPGTAAVGDVLAAEPAPGVTVEVLALPGDDPLPPGHDPAMRRRRDRPAGEGPPRRALRPA